MSVSSFADLDMGCDRSILKHPLKRSRARDWLIRKGKNISRIGSAMERRIEFRAIKEKLIKETSDSQTRGEAQRGLSSPPKGCALLFVNCNTILLNLQSQKPAEQPEHGTLDRRWAQGSLYKLQQQQGQFYNRSLLRYACDYRKPRMRFSMCVWLYLLSSCRTYITAVESNEPIP